METIFSFDDGTITDIRMAKLLKKYNVQGIFYIPVCCELENEQIQEIIDMGFEIGGHTYTHPQDLKQLNDYDLMIELKDSKQLLEDIFNIEITKFAYPRGKYNDETIKAVKKYGYKQARTTYSGNVIPFDELEPYRISPSVHLFPDNEKYNKPNWIKESKRLFKKAKDINGRFELWGHSKDLKEKDWIDLEKFLKYIKDIDN